MTFTSLVVLTPIKQSPDHNIVRIHREVYLDESRILHVAGGEHVGIIINKHTALPDDSPPDVELTHSVWLSDGNERKQERRTMRFRLSQGVAGGDGRAVVHKFFQHLMSQFPKDYVTLMRRVLACMQREFAQIACVELDMLLVEEAQQVAIPDAAQYDSGSEVEAATAGHVQEVLEHAYPNGLTIPVIAEALRISDEEALSLLVELESAGVCQRVGDEWLRVDQRNVDGITTSCTPSPTEENANAFSSRISIRDYQHHKRVCNERRHYAASSSSSAAESPTVAIITSLFVEKQAVDAMIDASSTIHKYKSGGDSNVYTLGRIGSHRVVATKLGLIGDSREATTSAGSITTRLLGNFQHIEHVFVVGVGGAVAHYTDAKLHARRGDVIVSSSCPDAYVYAHDVVVDRKTHQLSGFAVRRWNPVDKGIEGIVSAGGDELRAAWDRLTESAVRKLDDGGEDASFGRPAADTDVLALNVGGGNVVVVPHPNQERNTAEVHLGSVGALASVRRPEKVEGQPEGNDDDTIGQLRERLSAEFDLRSLDVGFDSVVAAIQGSRIDSWAMVRGVADYQHGHSRAARAWQAHASARAAAMTRAIIERLPSA